jgi:hypothetical protein
LKLIALSDEVMTYGVPTEGMRLEIAEARRLGIPVVAGDDESASALTGEPPPIVRGGGREAGTT